MSEPTVSVVISNYNYGRFLAQAIDSALGQTYPRTEVVVVDDGSTDDSREVVARFGGRVVPLFKDNGGMGSAYNAGWRHSRGEVVLFLDSDDLLLPSAAAEAARCFEGGGVAKAHWRLWEVDAAGRRTGQVIPGQELGEGDLREAAVREGPDCYLSPPTTGNAWSRAFLDDVLPVPEDPYRRHADSYLTTLAPVFGGVRRVGEPQGCYRVHGRNDYACSPADEKNRRNLEIYDRRCLALSEYLARKGVDVDRAVWKQRNPYYGWMRRLLAATERIAAATPPGSTLILVDEDQWADRWGGSEVIGGRRAVPFLERGGRYWGPPPDDATAVAELERLRRAGAGFLAVGWPAFWWLDHYTGLRQHLRTHYRCVAEDEGVVLFDLRSVPADGPALA